MPAVNEVIVFDEEAGWAHNSLAASSKQKSDSNRFCILDKVVVEAQDTGNEAIVHF